MLDGVILAGADALNPLPERREEIAARLKRVFSSIDSLYEFFSSIFTSCRSVPSIINTLVQIDENLTNNNTNANNNNSPLIEPALSANDNNKYIPLDRGRHDNIMKQLSIFHDELSVGVDSDVETVVHHLVSTVLCHQIDPVLALKWSNPSIGGSPALTKEVMLGGPTHIRYATYFLSENIGGGGDCSGGGNDEVEGGAVSRGTLPSISMVQSPHSPLSPSHCHSLTPLSPVSTSAVSVVVKVIDIANTSGKTAFFQESLRLRTLNHDCLPVFYGIHWPNVNLKRLRAYIVLERLTCNLKEARHNPALRSSHTRLLILRNIATAVQFLHSSRVRHASVTPSNVLLHIHNGAVQGSAKLDVSHLAVRTVCSQFRDDIVCSSLLPSIFAPPEVVASLDDTWYSGDVWSFGILASYLFHEDPSVFDDVRTVWSDLNRKSSHSLIRRFADGVANEVCKQLIIACLRIEPRERPTIRQVVSMLNRVPDKQDSSVGEVQVIEDGVGSDPCSRKSSQLASEPSLASNQVKPQELPLHPMSCTAPDYKHTGLSSVNLNGHSSPPVSPVVLKSQGNSQASKPAISLPHSGLKPTRLSFSFASPSGSPSVRDDSHSSPRTPRDPAAEPPRHGSLSNNHVLQTQQCSTVPNDKLASHSLSTVDPKQARAFSNLPRASPAVSNGDLQNITDKTDNGPQPIRLPVQSLSSNVFSPRANEVPCANSVPKSTNLPSQLHLYPEAQNFPQASPIPPPSQPSKQTDIQLEALETPKKPASVLPLRPGRNTPQQFPLPVTARPKKVFQPTSRRTSSSLDPSSTSLGHVSDPINTPVLSRLPQENVQISIAAESHKDRCANAEEKSDIKPGCDPKETVTVSQPVVYATISSPELLSPREDQEPPQHFSIKPRLSQVHLHVTDLEREASVPSMGSPRKKPRNPIVVSSSDSESFNSDDSNIVMSSQRNELRKVSTEADKLNDIGERYVMGTNGVVQDHEEAFRYFRKAAKGGSAKGHYNLACCYEHGRGTKRDRPMAGSHFRKAARMGHAVAQVKMAQGHERGDTKMDQEAAYYWYCQAAAQGDSDALFKVAEALQEGKGTARDYAEAFDKFQEAASKGHVEAEFRAGLMLEQGLGVPKNSKLAVEFYKKAGGKNCANALAHLGMCYKVGHVVQKDESMSAKYFLQASHLTQASGMVLYETAVRYEHGKGVSVNLSAAAKMYEDAAQKGHLKAMVRVGDIYDLGLFGQPIQPTLARRYWSHAAENGCGEAMIKLGHLAETGKGSKKMPDKALSWYKKAISSGSAEACARAGLLFERGAFGKKSMGSAADFYEKGAKLGNAESEGLLGQCYLTGCGRKVDIPKAVLLFRSAASKGDALSQFELGDCYKGGIGVQADMEEACILFIKAAEKGYAEAQLRYAECLLKGTGVEKNIKNGSYFLERAIAQGCADAMKFKADYLLETKDESFNAKVVMDLYRSGAEKKDSACMLSLGNIYDTGDIVPVDKKKAIYWYKRSGDCGCGLGMSNVGVMYEKGDGVKQNYAKAVEFYERGVKLGSSEAMSNLADCYMKGNGVEQNMVEAIKLFTDAVEMNDPAAHADLGACYYDGNGVEIDYRRAVTLLKKASDMGESEGTRRLALAYQEGRGVPCDLLYAAKLFDQAVEMGNTDALVDCGRFYRLGLAGHRDSTKAAKFFQKAADDGNKDAMMYLANMYLAGEGVKQDNASAIKLFAKVLPASLEVFSTIGARPKITDPRSMALWSATDDRAEVPHTVMATKLCESQAD